MADAAFKTAAFPGYTTKQLRNIIAARKAEGFSDDAQNSSAMRAEIARREAVAQGDESQMTAGERLRFVRAHPEGRA